MSAASIEWISVDSSLPDAELEVLIALTDGSVETGYLGSGNVWMFVPCCPVDQGNGNAVYAWAEYPDPPARGKEAE